MTATLATELTGLTEGIARTLARKHHLVAADGTIHCWNCGAREALLPSLHCHVCLAEARRRLNLGVGLCVNRAQTEADKAAMRG